MKHIVIYFFFSYILSVCCWTWYDKYRFILLFFFFFLFQEAECKVYKRRWLMLAIFVIYSTSNAMQWIQYSIITNVVMEYYGVASTWVDWTSMIYMITYIPLIFPGSWILDKWVSYWKTSPVRLNLALADPTLPRVVHFKYCLFDFVFDFNPTWKTLPMGISNPVLIDISKIRCSIGKKKKNDGPFFFFFF